MSSKFDAWGWPAALLLLAAALGGRACLGWSAAAAGARELSDARMEVRRLSGERDRLKGELDAMARDPIYLERLLRENRRVSPDEDLRERP